MIRTVFAITAFVGLSACGDGNPFANQVGLVVPDSVLTGTEIDSDMTANSVVYDDNGTPSTADDTLVINNLPFDNSDLRGGEYTQVTSLPNGFDAFESPLTGNGGDRQYFAVFRRGDHVQAAATATNDYISAGFGGTVAERLGGGNVPAARPASYVFSGEYAGLRVYRGSGIADAGYVTGDAVVYVDVLDFDVTGAVEGSVSNRQVYTLSGAYVYDLDDYISMATAEINFDNATTNQSSATLQAGLEELGTGGWTSIFGGPNGEELAGIVVIDGTPSQTEIDNNGLPADTTVRENGVFIVLNGG